MLIILAVALLVAAATVAVVLVTVHNARHTRASEREVQILASGRELVADVLVPRGTAPFPLVVMPGSWGSNDHEYEALATRMADTGFTVVQYAQAGFGGSQGLADFGGVQTQRDVSTVIDWAIAHAHADARRVGLLGISLGAGVSLLAAARDERVRAVAAMSTWTDLAAAFHPNGTTASYALGLVLNVLDKRVSLSNDLAKVDAELPSDPVAAGVHMSELSAPRSPAALVRDLNAHHTAIMLANGWEDSIFPPQPVVDFYDRLTTPKRLQFGPGDHASPEHSGLGGRSNPVTDAARQWLERYVAGVPNGIQDQPPVAVQDVVSRVWHKYRSWPQARATSYLAQPGTDSGLSPARSASWTATITAGTDTVARSGPSQFFSPAGYVPPRISVAALDTTHAFVWAGPRVSAATTVSGTPHLDLVAGSSTGSGTVFCYLYDVDDGGAGRLMSVTPYTFTAAGRISLDLEPISWTIAAGHRLDLVIDTVDSRWHSVSPPGSTLTLSSSSGAPATIALPVG